MCVGRRSRAGIGYGLARRLADDGCRIYATDRDEGLAKAVAERLGGTALRPEISDSRS